jgi:phage terminase Nu1 subunit (DNA packaging protein)
MRIQEHPKTDGKLVSRAELAEIFGVALTTVDGWVRKGCPVHRKAPKRGIPAEFDTAQVIRWREREGARRFMF